MTPMKWGGEDRVGTADSSLSQGQGQTMASFIYFFLKNESFLSGQLTGHMGSH